MHRRRQLCLALAYSVYLFFLNLLAALADDCADGGNCSVTPRNIDLATGLAAGITGLVLAVAIAPVILAQFDLPAGRLFRSARKRRPGEEADAEARVMDAGSAREGEQFASTGLAHGNESIDTTAASRMPAPPPPSQDIPYTGIYDGAGSAHESGLYRAAREAQAVAAARQQAATEARANSYLPDFLWDAANRNPIAGAAEQYQRASQQIDVYEDAYKLARADGWSRDQAHWFAGTELQTWQSDPAATNIDVMSKQLQTLSTTMRSANLISSPSRSTQQLAQAVQSGRGRQPDTSAAETAEESARTQTVAPVSGEAGAANAHGDEQTALLARQPSGGMDAQAHTVEDIGATAQPQSQADLQPEQTLGASNSRPGSVMAEQQAHTAATADTTGLARGESGEAQQHLQHELAGQQDVAGSARTETGAAASRSTAASDASTLAHADTGNEASALSHGESGSSAAADASSVARTDAGSAATGNASAVSHAESSAAEATMRHAQLGARLQEQAASGQIHGIKQVVVPAEASAHTSGTYQFIDAQNRQIPVEVYRADFPATGTAHSPVEGIAGNLATQIQRSGNPADVVVVQVGPGEASSHTAGQLSGTDVESIPYRILAAPARSVKRVIVVDPDSNILYDKSLPGGGASAENWIDPRYNQDDWQKYQSLLQPGERGQRESS